MIFFNGKKMSTNNNNNFKIQHTQGSKVGQQWC